jgi:hypothetical protein
MRHLVVGQGFLWAGASGPLPRNLSGEYPKKAGGCREKQNAEAGVTEKVETKTGVGIWNAGLVTLSGVWRVVTGSISVPNAGAKWSSEFFRIISEVPRFQGVW